MKPLISEWLFYFIYPLNFSIVNLRPIEAKLFIASADFFICWLTFSISSLSQLPRTTSRPAALNESHCQSQISILDNWSRPIPVGYLSIHCGRHHFPFLLTLICQDPCVSHLKQPKVISFNFFLGHPIIDGFSTSIHKSRWL